MGKVCGQFTISPDSCSGSLTWVGMEGDLFQFQASNKAGDVDNGLIACCHKRMAALYTTTGAIRELPKITGVVQFSTHSSSIRLSRLGVRDPQPKSAV
jgi:hypothetical protein